MERDNVTSLVLACGAKRPKQLHPRQLGEFQVTTNPSRVHTRRLQQWLGHSEDLQSLWRTTALSNPAVLCLTRYVSVLMLGEKLAPTQAACAAGLPPLGCCCCLSAAQAAGLPLKRKLWECKVTEDAIMPPGTLIGASHFRAGQYLDITGVG